MMSTKAFDVARDSKPTWFGTAAVLCFVYATLGLVLMHWLRPDYVPRSHMISDYAVGRYGWVMQTVFVSMGLGDFMLAIGLVRCGPLDSGQDWYSVTSRR